MQWHLLHPIAVHFPVALLITGLAAFLSFRAGKGPPWLSQASSWLLWLGTLAAWAAMGLGLLAEKTAPHVPSAWEVLDHHETLAYWTVGLFSALSLWRWRMPGRGEKYFWIAWLAAVGVLIATAFHGGELVFHFGMGVVP